MSLIKNFQYRPEIDGLRALAVLAVLFYHVGLGFPGGYIGVDIFFVISGYLITSLILKELEEGKFTLVNFWERRARRILPALAVVVMATLAAGWILLPPFDYRSLAMSAAAQAVFAANFYFWRTTNYFSGPADEQPLLHTWSLAVEEQFYLFMPLALMALFCFRWSRSRGALLTILTSGLVVSLALSVALLSRSQPMTFYLLPTRAWELLCGSLVALVPLSKIPRSRFWREMLVGTGLAGMLVPCFVYDGDTPFPGLAALPPCLGAALFIFGAAPREGAAGPALARGFEFRPLVFIGLISYSLYLWHWPLVAFGHYWLMEGQLALGTRWAIVSGSLLLALLSWRFVETPFRIRKLGKSRNSMFAYAAGGIAAVIGSVLLILHYGGFPQRFSERVVAFNEAKKERHQQDGLRQNVGPSEVRRGELPEYGGAGPVSLLVWGDSHARSILPAADAAAKRADRAAAMACYSATPPLSKYIPSPLLSSSLGRRTPDYADAVVTYLEENKVSNVLLAARWSGYVIADQKLPATDSPNDLASALLSTVGDLGDRGIRVWILREVPNHRAEVPKILVSAEVRGTDVGGFASGVDDVANQNEWFDELAPELRRRGARIIDLADLLWDEDVGHFAIQRDGVPIYFDTHHLTRAGARMLSSALDPIFSQENPEAMKREAPQRD